MAKKNLFNDARPSYESIVEHHSAVEEALRQYFSPGNSAFVSMSAPELSEALDRELEFQEQQNVLTLVAFLEATFRVDYLSRKDRKLKDDLSKALIKVFNRRRQKASLADDIIKTWLRQGTLTHAEYFHIDRSFKFRHWLAHGQYWSPTEMLKRDFYEVATLVEGLRNSKSFVTQTVESTHDAG